MADEKFNDPNITISKVFTKRGDDGTTDLIGEKQVSKDDHRVCAYGELDELNVYIGGCINSLNNLKIDGDIEKLLFLKDILLTTQNKIFNLGNMIATVDENILVGMPQVTEKDLNNLEEYINSYNKDLPNLSSFVLPGGSNANIWFNLSRTVSRKCERLIIKLHKVHPQPPIVLKYINRLSDAFFVWGRWVNHSMRIEENLWDPNKDVE